MVEALRSVLCHINIAHVRLSGSIAVLSFEVLELSREFADLHKKYNWQRASTELAICTACIEGRRVEPRSLLHALSLCVAGKNNIGRF